MAKAIEKANDQNQIVVDKEVEKYVLEICKKAELEATRTIDMTEAEAKVISEYIKQHGEYSIAQLDAKNQMKDRICRYVCCGLETIGRVAAVAATVMMFREGLELEQTGSFTTTSMRSLVNKNAGNKW